MYNPMAVPVQIDAKDPNSMFAEKAAITLADRINVRRLKSAKRPEMDWHSVPDDKVYEFVLWHEIGHRMNNFYIPDVWRAVDGLERAAWSCLGGRSEPMRCWRIGTPGGACFQIEGFRCVGICRESNAAS